MIDAHVRVQQLLHFTVHVSVHTVERCPQYQFLLQNYAIFHEQLLLFLQAFYH